MAFANLAAIRATIRSACVFARGPVAVQDTDLLRDAADALKHAVLGRQNSAIAGASAIVSISNGYGEMRYGEQKHGGKEQVKERITLKDAVIVNVSRYSSSHAKEKTEHDVDNLEDVSFRFREITVENPLSSTSVTDNWNETDLK